MFLSKDEVRTLTGRALKKQQIVQLRRMGLPFFVNAAGWPIVAKAVIEGGNDKHEQDKAWRPEVLGT